MTSENTVTAAIVVSGIMGYVVGFIAGYFVASIG